MLRSVTDRVKASLNWLRDYINITCQLGGMGGESMRQMKIIVEKHPEGYVAYPLGLKGVVVGEGDTYEEALADVKSAIRFHIETFVTEVAVE